MSKNELNTTWRQLISDCMESHDESWADVVSNTMTEKEMDVEFYSGFGRSKGCPFTIWTHKRVYFPAVYDGAEWVESVARNPDGQPTKHIGGE